VISTKKSTWGEHPLTPDDVRVSLNASLQRLGTDYVDIYHLHGVQLEQYEYLTAEIVPTLFALRNKGKIRFLGITEAFGPDPGHAMFQRALQDDFWDVIMVGFNILNQSARQRVLPMTIEKNIGVLVMFAIRNALSRPERLKEVVQELIEKGQLDPSEIDVNAPLNFLMHEGDALSLPDAAYRFCRDEPGTHVTLSGTGNPGHVQANVEALSRPPLSLEITEQLKHIFRNVDSVAGN
jgi:aryl-alcohol dehydrogenase-like predicted oxidoreductase